MATRCALQTSLPVKAVQATNLIEQGGKPLRQRGGAIPLEFRAFEIKTLRLRLKRGSNQ
jgi:alpha-mannosidase